MRGFVFKLCLLFAIACSVSCITAKVVTTNNNVSVAMPDSVYPPASLKINGHTDYTKRHYPERVAYFKANPLQMHDVVFLGNSITEMGADWGKRLGLPGIKNRGIGGDVTAGVLQRLGEITYVKPKAVFLLIGINDINHTGLAPEQIAGNILKIAKAIRGSSPSTKVFVQTIFPTSRENIKAKIVATNNWILKNKAAGNYTVIDTHRLLRDDNGMMLKDCTYDGIHLTQVGYKAWVAKLKSYFK